MTKIKMGLRFRTLLSGMFLQARWTYPETFFVTPAKAGVHFDSPALSETWRRSKWIDQPSAVEVRLCFRRNDEDGVFGCCWKFESLALSKPGRPMATTGSEIYAKLFQTAEGLYRNEDSSSFGDG